jgi:hypothetical protein
MDGAVAPRLPRRDHSDQLDSGVCWWNASFQVPASRRYMLVA